MNTRKIVVKIFLAVLTGLAAFAAVPKIDLFFLMWTAFIPLIVIVCKTQPKQSFFYALLAGFIFYGASMYWLTIMLKFNTGSWISASFASVLLWSYLALYWGIWGFLVNILNKIYRSKFILCLLSASIWIILEYVRTYFLTGFPWLLLGYSQYKFIQIIQIAQWSGVYGISFLIILCNMLFYFWLSAKKNIFMFAAAALITICAVFGVYQTEKFQFYGTKEFNVSIIQPNIEQEKKWDKDYSAEITASLYILSEEASKKEPDIVLFPEASMPHFISGNPDTYKDIRSLVKTAGAFSIIGAPFYDDKGQSFNSVFAFEKEKERFSQIHRKNHLVPFGEFVPLRRFLSKFIGVLNMLGDFEKGEDKNLLTDGKIYAGALICSENFFPDISRRLVLNGAEVLTNHTNDGWFFKTSAPHQHFIMNVLRAVENRKAVLISANTGVSGIVEASGRIVTQSPVFESGIINGSFLPNNFRTFYTKRGDVFVSANAVFLCLFLIFIPAFKYRKYIIKWIQKWIKSKQNKTI